MSSCQTYRLTEGLIGGILPSWDRQADVLIRLMTAQEKGEKWKTLKPSQVNDRNHRNNAAFCWMFVTTKRKYWFLQSVIILKIKKNSFKCLQWKTFDAFWPQTICKTHILNDRENVISINQSRLCCHFVSITSKKVVFRDRKHNIIFFVFGRS